MGCRAGSDWSDADAEAHVVTCCAISRTSTPSAAAALNTRAPSQCSGNPRSLALRRVPRIRNWCSLCTTLYEGLLQKLHPV